MIAPGSSRLCRQARREVFARLMKSCSTTLTNSLASGPIQHLPLKQRDGISRASRRPKTGARAARKSTLPLTIHTCAAVRPCQCVPSCIHGLRPQATNPGVRGRTRRRISRILQRVRCPLIAFVFTRWSQPLIA